MTQLIFIAPDTLSLDLMSLFKSNEEVEQIERGDTEGSKFDDGDTAHSRTKTRSPSK